MNSTIVGNRIKSRREELGITQDELAKRAGYAAKSSISLIESGRVTPPYDKFYLIAKCLACDPLYLMGASDEPNSKDFQWLTLFDDYIHKEPSNNTTPVINLSKPTIEINNLIADLPESEQWKLVGRVEAYVEGLSKNLKKGDPDEKI